MTDSRDAMIICPDLRRCRITTQTIRSDLKDSIRAQAEALGGLVDGTRKTRVWSVPAAFDIESTSWWDGDTPRANMYLWTFALGGWHIYGRTWEEWAWFEDVLISALDLAADVILPVYVHNLPYEFQWIQRREKWDEVFAIRERKVIRATTVDGIQYRCSLALSGYSLASLGRQLQKYKVLKAEGDLDYNLIRHSDTPLTDTELWYGVRDVCVVTAYIKEYIERVGTVEDIPLTKTGAVRRRMRERCFAPAYAAHIRREMRQNTLSPEIYKMARRAFQGGFTHASWLRAGEVQYNVASYDETSAYPAVMLAYTYPDGPAEFDIPLTDKQFRSSLRHYACLFDVEIYGLRPKLAHEHALAVCHCWLAEGVVQDNGRVVSADKIATTCTDVDWEVLEMYYTWDHIRLGSFYRWRRCYLPRPFAEVIVELYAKKTELKGVKGSELEYLLSKEDINSVYGMTATDPLRPSYTYDTIGQCWMDPQPPDIDDAIDKYNKQYNRFQTYLWGVWVTSYARYNLLWMIAQLGTDYIYSDTDSIKLINADAHTHIFDAYNNRMRANLNRSFAYWGFDPKMAHPYTVNGVEKPLGAWDYEGTYKRFKTLGAKRYMSESTDGNLSLTVSGLNKKTCVPWMLQQWGIDGAFEHFDDSLVVPAEYTGKLTHWYVDDEYTAHLTDYTGRTAEVHELNYVSLAPAEYSLTIDPIYKAFTAQGRGKHLYIDNGGV